MFECLIIILCSACPVEFFAEKFNELAKLLISIGDRSNAVYFGLGIFLELVGIPTVCDIGLALYSKVRRKTGVIFHSVLLSSLWIEN
jgi:hypothetical protein